MKKIFACFLLVLMIGMTIMPAFAYQACTHLDKHGDFCGGRVTETKERIAYDAKLYQDYSIGYWVMVHTSTFRVTKKCSKGHVDVYEYTKVQREVTDNPVGNFC